MPEPDEVEEEFMNNKALKKHNLQQIQEQYKSKKSLGALQGNEDYYAYTSPNQSRGRIDSKDARNSFKRASETKKKELEKQSS
jgi:hypothetical protein